MKGERRNGGTSSFRAIVLAGAKDGLVKQLPGFDRKRHTPPRWASERAQAFLERLAQPELETWGSERFRRLRESMGYRRTELEVVAGAGTCRLASNDFVLERRYALRSEAPERYEATTELSEVGSEALLRNEAFGEAVGPIFDRARFVFRGAISVESVIDAIEELEGDAVTVDYPPSCERCDARVEGVEAAFRFEPAWMEMRLPYSGYPCQLAEAMDRLRHSGSGEVLNELLRA